MGSRQQTKRLNQSIGVMLTILLVVGLLTAPAMAAYHWSIGGGGGIVSTTGSGDLFALESSNAFGFSIGHRLSDHWQLEIDYSKFTLANDTTVIRADSVGMLYNNSPLDFGAARLGLRFDRKLLAPERPFNITAGFGGGLLIWEAREPHGDTVYQVLNGKEQTIDFAATELFFTGAAGILFTPSQRWSLHLAGQIDYLTGAGADFETAISDGRDRLILTTQVRLAYHFGSKRAVSDWGGGETLTSSTAAAATARITKRDSDGDGVADYDDVCLNTPRGVTVDGKGCPVDSDHDGVPNGLDDCPSTPTEARGQVDIHGCAVDTDFDGLADYADSCAFNPVGAIIDENGCPIDSDNDGVPDGLDDCPYTLVAVEVDKHGCIDLTMLSTPMVLNIDYAPGSFEVDPHNATRLERLAGLLNFVKDIKLDISGYTDDIGPTVANRTLSEKRANRVKGILESLGIEPDRIKVFGRGETNFVASNQTADGRAKNRRIEIVFYH